METRQMEKNNSAEENEVDMFSDTNYEPKYQINLEGAADIPQYQPLIDADIEYRDFPEEKIWTPQDDESEWFPQYINIARSCLTIVQESEGIPKDEAVQVSCTGDAEQYMTDLLHDCDYTMSTALSILLYKDVPPHLVSTWSPENIDDFVKGLKRYGKNFTRIHEKLLPTKTTDEIVKFYYSWKMTEMAKTMRKTPSKAFPSKETKTKKNTKSTTEKNQLPLELNQSKTGKRQRKVGKRQPKAGKRQLKAEEHQPKAEKCPPNTENHQPRTRKRQRKNETCTSNAEPCPSNAESCISSIETCTSNIEMCTYSTETCTCSTQTCTFNVQQHIPRINCIPNVPYAPWYFGASDQAALAAYKFMLQSMYAQDTEIVEPLDLTKRKQISEMSRVSNDDRATIRRNVNDEKLFGVQQSFSLD